MSKKKYSEEQIARAVERYLLADPQRSNPKRFLMGEPRQGRPYTCVDIELVFCDEPFGASGFSKASYPDQWHPGMGLWYAINDALKRIAEKAALHLWSNGDHGVWEKVPQEIKDLLEGDSK